MIQSHRDLIVWQKSIDLVARIYAITRYFPKSELYGMCDQMRRSAVSIPTNIAEGRKFSSRAEFRRYLSIAYGSGSELETELLIAQRLSFGRKDEVQAALSLLNEVMRMLGAMMIKLKED
jgi:four helix bundle protein